MDQRYLNYENATIVSPLRKLLGIEMYNEVHFHPKPPNTTSTIVNLSSTSIDAEAFKPYNKPITPSDDVSTTTHTKFNYERPIEQLVEPPSMNYAELRNVIITSTDKLCFVQYTPAGTMRPLWYLVQIDLISTAELNPQWEGNRTIFLRIPSPIPNRQG